jgi:negative regulator of sigma E activity
MNTTTKLSLAAMLALSIATPVQAQNPKQGDYYAPGQTTPQQLSPSQEQQIKQGDYYSPGQTTPQKLSPGQEQQIKQGDYYKPDSK